MLKQSFAAQPLLVELAEEIAARGQVIERLNAEVERLNAEVERLQDEAGRSADRGGD